MQEITYRIQEFFYAVAFINEQFFSILLNLNSSID